MHLTAEARQRGGLCKVLKGALDGHGLLEELARVVQRLGQVARLPRSGRAVVRVRGSAGSLWH